MRNPRSAMALLALLITSSASAGPLRGALIVAADGTFLGTCNGTYDRLSIANKFSQYGSEYSGSSIFNKYGRYGNEYSSNSAFNPYTSSAPYLLASDPELIAMFTAFNYRSTPQIVDALRSSGANRVSANRNLLRAIDPNVLRVACESP